MPDGRLGLLDYGMVGRLNKEERRRIAATVIALSKKDKEEVVRLYQEGGYSAYWAEGWITDTNILHRFAGFHLDKVDFSPVTTEEQRSICIIEILKSTVEHQTPHWVEKCRRSTAILMGTALQAARPLSLSKEWYHIAKQTVDEFDQQWRLTTQNSKNQTESFATVISSE